MRTLLLGMSVLSLTIPTPVNGAIGSNICILHTPCTIYSHMRIRHLHHNILYTLFCPHLFKKRSIVVERVACGEKSRFLFLFWVVLSLRQQKSRRWKNLETCINSGRFRIFQPNGLSLGRCYPLLFFLFFSSSFYYGLHSR